MRAPKIPCVVIRCATNGSGPGLFRIFISIWSIRAILETSMCRDCLGKHGEFVDPSNTDGVPLKPRCRLHHQSQNIVCRSK